MKKVFVLTMKKGCHSFAFLYHDDRIVDLYRALASMVSNPELPFTWADAVKMKRASDRLKMDKTG